MLHDETLDVIVRFHDVRRLWELERCVFSLVGQTYRPLHINVALQRFTPEAVSTVRSALDPLLASEDRLALSLLNWECPEPSDARSALLNMGLDAVQGRYFAILDYDDVLYPEAYETFVARLQSTDAVIAFADIVVKRVDVYDTFLYGKEKVSPFIGSSLRDLLAVNFAPIHSYVIDRIRIPRQELFFEHHLNMQEDYDFLLRVCAQFISDFGLMGTVLGEYNYKTDGSNTVPTEGGVPESDLHLYERVVKFIEQRRCITPVSVKVQRHLGVKQPIPGLTIREFLDGATPIVP